MKAPADEQGYFEGYASTFGNVDLGNDVVVEGAFKESLAEWNDKKQLPVMPWFHNMDKLVGDFLSMEERAEGLFVKGQFWLGEKATQLSQMAYNLYSGTGPKAMSIGYKTLDFADEAVDGEMVRMLKKVKLFEVSILPFGMNPEAVATNVKTLIRDDGQAPDKRSLERYLRDGGLSTKQAKTLLSKGYAGISRDEENAQLLAMLKESTF